MSLVRFAELIATKVRLNLKAEAAKSYLSYAWWILEPALFVAVFYFVFGVFLSGRTENFVTFLVCGKIPFLWFSRTVTNSANSIVNGRGLMNQIAIPKTFFPLVVVFQDFCKSIVVFLLMLVFVWLSGFQPVMSWISIIPLMLTQLVFLTALALICAAVVPFLPDLKFIIQTGIMLMMFASGIFYSYKDVILPEHQTLFLLNPLANLIRMYREVLMEGLWPDWLDVAGIASASGLVIVLMIWVYSRIGSKYPRLVLQ